MEMEPGMDLLQGVQDAGNVPQGDVPGIGDMPFQMPSLEKMIEILSGMDMPEEEKAQIIDNLKNRGDFLAKMGGMAGAMKNAVPPPVGGLHDPTNKFLFFLAAFLLILLIFVFFGYKLYKSLVEKERRREEKKKQKQQKKKK